MGSSYSDAGFSQHNHLSNEWVPQCVWDIFVLSGCLFAEYSAQDVLWESGKGKVFTSNLKACVSVQALCNLCVCVCVKGLASEFGMMSERLLQT